MRSKSDKPSEREQEILQVLWNKGPSTVREVLEEINKKKEARQVGYTTILKMMQIMHGKDLLSREMDGISHIYAPTVSEEENASSRLSELLKTTFKGSKARLVMQLLGNHHSDDKELNEIRDFLDTLDKEGDNTKN